MDMNVPPQLDLAPQRAELTRLGFEIVEGNTNAFTAVRSVRAEDLAGIQWTVILRVRRLPHIDAATIRTDQAALRADAPALVPEAKAPLGRRNYRAEILCYLTDTADDDARAIAVAPPPYDMNAHVAVGILEASGQQSRHTGSGPVLWATRPKVNYLVGRVLDPTSQDTGEPRSAMTTWFRWSRVLFVVTTLISLGLIASLVLFMALVMLVVVGMFVGIGAFLMSA
jgi:hypothetical protein